MRKSIVTIIVALMLFVTGCATLDSMFLPNENGTPSGTMQVVQDVENAATAVGGPYAIPVLAVTNLLSIIAGVYANARKKQVIAAKDDVAEQTKIVMEAIIAAVEESEGVVVNDEGLTVGRVVKDNVTDKLMEADAYKIGKAIIDSLKTYKEED